MTGVASVRSPAWARLKAALGLRTAQAVRLALKGIGLALPVVLLWGSGWLWLRPYSRQYNLDWAQQPTDLAGIIPDIKALQPSSIDEYRTPEIIRWLLALRLVQANRGLSSLENPLKNVVPAESIAAMNAKLALKFRELEMTDLLRASLDEIGAPERSTPVVAAAIKWTSSTIGLRDQRARNMKSDLNITSFTTFDDLKNRADRNGPDDPAATLLWLAQISELTTITPTDCSYLADNVRQNVKELLAPKYDLAPDKRFDAMQDVLSIYQHVLEVSGAGTSVADRILDDAITVAKRPMRVSIEQPYPKAQVEALVLVAKSCRWPSENRTKAFALLNRAASVADSEGAPDQRSHLLVRVAAGYARLGALSKARELSATASAREKFAVAREMLCNEIEEHAALKARAGQEHPARKFNRMTQVFDEMLDVVRGHSGIQQMVPRWP